MVDVVLGRAKQDSPPLFVLTGRRFLHLSVKMFFGSQYLADEVPLTELTGVEHAPRRFRSGSVTVFRAHGEPMRLTVFYDEDGERFAQTVRDVIAGRAQLTPPPEFNEPSPALQALLQPGEEIITTVQTIESLKRGSSLAATNRRLLHLEFSLSTEEPRILREVPAAEVRSVKLSNGMLRDTITVKLHHGEPFVFTALRRPSMLHEANQKFVTDVKRLLKS